MAQKVLLFILGGLLLIGGIYCMAAPGITYMVIAPVAGIGMIVDAVASFVMWNNLRKVGFKNTIMLVGAILSLILGIALLVSLGMQLVFDTMIAIMVAIWLILSGVMRIVAGMRMKKKVLMIVMGVLLIICGIFGLVNPVSIMLALGMIIGLSIVMSGVAVLALAFAA